jgi:RNA polymerase sigma-70 factor (ECF subfamily)
MLHDDQAWLKRFREGDPRAFDDLYAEYAPRLYHFALRLCGSTADAEDLAQEVLLAAYIGLPFFEGRSTISTYLYRITVYRWRHLRTARRRAAGNVEGWIWEVPNSPDPACIGLARLELREALAALPAAHREAFLLVKVEGFTCREAADALDVPEGTVKYHVFEAVRRLRTLVEGPVHARPAGKVPAEV